MQYSNHALGQHTYPFCPRHRASFPGEVRLADGFQKHLQDKRVRG